MLRSRLVVLARPLPRRDIHFTARPPGSRWSRGASRARPRPRFQVPASGPMFVIEPGPVLRARTGIPKTKPPGRARHPVRIATPLNIECPRPSATLAGPRSINRPKVALMLPRFPVRSACLVQRGGGPGSAWWPSGGRLAPPVTFAGQPPLASRLQGAKARAPFGLAGRTDPSHSIARARQVLYCGLHGHRGISPCRRSAGSTLPLDLVNRGSFDTEPA